MHVGSFSYWDFANGFNRNAAPQTDPGQIFRHREQEFPELYGLEFFGEFAEIKCLATLQVDPNDPALYGTYMITSGTTFYMQDKTEHVMSTTEWFVDLTSDKTTPPKKEF